MNISLTPEQEKIVEAIIFSGKYDSPNEVIDNALKLLNERFTERQQHLQEFRTEIQKGIDSGPTSPFDMDEFIQESRSRWAQSSQRPE